MVVEKNSILRLDVLLVQQGLARSRDHAVRMIRQGRVRVGDTPVSKPSTKVDAASLVSIIADDNDRWASRGAHKLLGALEAFGLDFQGKRVLDAGASTGGFTDVCLEYGAQEVHAVDVGHNQLIERLHKDPRVHVYDKTNIRSIEADLFGDPCDAMVGDLSFISLRLALPPIVACLTEDAVLLPMLKPQFEVGKERISSDGVVRSAALREEVTVDIALFSQSLGLSLKNIIASPLPGSHGNVEYFLHLVKNSGEEKTEEEIRAMVHKAVAEGPQ